MVTQTARDFVVDTGGHCFICMKDILSSRLSSDTSQMEPFSQVPSSICSLQQLSRYLKLKMSRVFNQENLIPKSLLYKVEMSNLKADLCEQCAGWTTKLSELYRKMEKIEIEAASYLKLIHDKLITKEAVEPNFFDKASENGLITKDGSMGKLEVTRSLRKETMQRCSQKLSTIHPKVRVNKLTEARIQQMSNRSEHSSSLPRSNQEINPKFNLEDFSNLASEMLDLKWEHREFDAVSNGSGHSFLDDLGTENEDSEGEEKADFVMMPIKVDTGNNSSSGNDTASKPSMYQRDPKTGKLKCSACLKTFKADASLFRHNQKVHLKIRYKCQLCDKVFTRSDNLKVHQKSVHFKQQFKCPTCPKSFATYSNKHRHVKICGSRNSKALSMQQN